MSEFTRDELDLILEALDDASFYRDARSLVLKGAVTRAGRPSPGVPPMHSGDVHREKAQAYRALMGKLRSERP
ncbi:MAG: hypothetical protein E6J20_11600 [Chloroflexi bacterium]|nr:MAG: hypothetical protein E6J20_11600 [Chloroflexota bacterium]